MERLSPSSGGTDHHYFFSGLNHGVGIRALKNRIGAEFFFNPARYYRHALHPRMSCRFDRITDHNPGLF
jgi:hypothetical protein